MVATALTTGLDALDINVSRICWMGGISEKRLYPHPRMVHIFPIHLSLTPVMSTGGIRRRRSMSTSTKTTTPALVIFGEDFEKHGGLRALAIADGMHDTDPVDDTGYHLDTLSSRLGDELALEGYKNWEELEPLADACFDLRMEYGHEVWIGAALLDYLRGVKGLSEADAISARIRMLAGATTCFAPIYADYERRRDISRLSFWADQVSRAVEGLKTEMGRILASNDGELRVA